MPSSDLVRGKDSGLHRDHIEQDRPESLAAALADDYAHLGPAMRQRLDEAERVESKLHNYLLLLAERGRESNLIAREICMIVGLDTLKANIDNTTWPWERAR